LDSTDGGKQDRGEWSMNSLCVYGNSWSSIKQTIAIRAHTKSTFRIDSHWIWFTEISQDPPTTVGKQHIKPWIPVDFPPIHWDSLLVPGWLAKAEDHPWWSGRGRTELSWPAAGKSAAVLQGCSPTS
jgi:hypothetical protein